MAKSIMIQGAGSNVGKSVLVAGLCRAAKKRGLRVAPFKPQNMSNNAMVTEDGGEIGRAQALQARACGLPLTVHMNPVLLKPEAENGSQVIVQGHRIGAVKAQDYGTFKSQLMPKVLESFDQLKAAHDLVIVEGAGSPAEVNLRAGDIANMGFAEAADVPVILVGDIDRGGVIAQLVGTQVVLPADDADRICGFLVNKFRGDTTLFDDGMSFVVERTGWTPLGIVPWFSEMRHLPAEDSLDLLGRRKEGGVTIAVPRLPRISNFDDLDPLAAEPSVDLILVEGGDVIPPETDLVILPGSKSTLSDLDWMKANGLDVDIAAHLRRGGRLLGLCGGYQMLSQTLSDPDGIEGPAREVDGLALLDVKTVMTAEKTLDLVTGTAPLFEGTQFTGYEIHIGRTSGPDCARPMLMVHGEAVGAVSETGQVMGCYVHGVFSDDAFRQAFLRQFDHPVSDLRYDQLVEDTLDRLADHIEASIDVDALLALAR